MPTTRSGPAQATRRRKPSRSEWDSRRRWRISRPRSGSLYGGRLKASPYTAMAPSNRGPRAEMLEIDQFMLPLAAVLDLAANLVLVEALIEVESFEQELGGRGYFGRGTASARLFDGC